MEVIQIFSPHIDDAIFSLGGSILNWKKKGYSIQVHNIFTISNWITPNSISGIKDPLNIREVTALRKLEEAEVGSQVKFDFHFWDFWELPLRANFSKTDDEKMHGEILDRISQCLNSEDLFFFPLGVEHQDHILIHELTANFINKGLNIFFYEDLPYVSWGKFDYAEAFKLQQLDKTPLVEKIDYNNKAAVLRKYSSQVREEFIKTMRAYSYNPLDNEYYERYWKQI